ncbi:MAG: ABC transporter ATP-binding protein [Thiolinea sp.]
MEIAELHRELGATTIYVTHDQVEAMTLADRVVVLRDGIIEQVGTPLELYDSPANRFVAQFIGMPQMNVVSVDMVGQAPTGAAEAGIRPEHFQMVAESEGRLTGKIEIIESLGNETLVHVYPDGYQLDLPLVIRMYSRTDAQVGDRVGLVWDASQVHYFDADGMRLGQVLQGAAA